jgi:3-oxoacyl-[acyl-carrier protein] reductase
MTSSAGLRKGNELAGKVALVTGGARNIGRAISRALAAGGAAVMVNAHTSEALGRETVAMIEQNGGRAALHIADVTDPQAVSRMMDEMLQRYGRLDILVNNAAVRVETAFEQTTLEEWRRVLAIVLDGAFICTQAALPHLKRSDAAAVVNIGGLTGHKGALNRAHVITAKAGLAGMTKALALDLAPHGITVNCVVPGTVETQRGLPGAPDDAADRAARGTRGNCGDGAAAVRTGCALRHRPVHTRERRRIHAVNTHTREREQ